MATTPKKRTTKAMSVEHKAALAKGRAEGAIVRSYLEALEQSKPKRGRQRTPESIKRQIAALEAKISAADNPLARLLMVQEKADLELEIESSSAVVDLSAKERAFIKVARSYGDRKGITYKTWRLAGISASVLKAAKVDRTRG